MRCVCVCVSPAAGGGACLRPPAAGVRKGRGLWGGLLWGGTFQENVTTTRIIKKKNKKRNQTQNRGDQTFFHQNLWLEIDHVVSMIIVYPPLKKYHLLLAKTQGDDLMECSTKPPNLVECSLFRLPAPDSRLPNPELPNAFQVSY